MQDVFLVAATAVTVGLTLRDHALDGWTPAAATAAFYAVAPLIAASRADLVGISTTSSGWVSGGALLLIVAVTGGRPLILAEYFLSDDALDPALRRRANRALVAFFGVVVVGAVIGALFGPDPSVDTGDR